MYRRKACGAGWLMPARKNSRKPSTMRHGLLAAMLATGVVSSGTNASSASIEARCAGLKRCRSGLAAVLALACKASLGGRLGSVIGSRGGHIVGHGFGRACGSCGWRAFETLGQIGAGKNDLFHDLRIGGVWPIAKVDFSAAVLPAVHLGKSPTTAEHQCNHEREMDPPSNTHH